MEIIPIQSFVETVLKLVKTKWVNDLNKVGLQIAKAENEIYVFVHKGEEIFRGTKKEAKEALEEYFKKGDEIGLEKYLDEVAEFFKKRTKPSKAPNNLAKPKGTVTRISKKADIETKTSLELENETADILAKNGFDIEQNPIIKGTSKEPDYLIEGKVFDCYAPFNKNKPVRGVWSEVQDKVLKDQTKRVVINLKNWEGDVSKLQQQFMDWAIEGLKEVMYISKDGKIDYITLK
ncbi:CdiA C-terminal domain-containing protein [Flavobacterium sp. HNIBRBA15423]|uniref:CdiA C-terminal domain-containing protein n=1 Tax=Flavobacterium sp. HNIBRBA15423 TaxID=3458683 RepID=UPI004044E463